MSFRTDILLLVTLGGLELSSLGQVASAAESEPTVVAAGPKLRFPKKGASSPRQVSTQAKRASGQPYSNQTRQQLEKSKRSYEDLIREHEQKLADYRKDPMSQDHKGVLRNAPPDLQQKIIEGRIKELEGQLAKQRSELKKIEDALQTLSGGN